MNWLLFVIITELGMVPSGEFFEGQPMGSWYEQGKLFQAPFYLKIDVTITAWDLVFIQGSLTNYAYFNSNSGYQFIPYYMSYKVSAGVKYREFEIGWRHFCNHPIHVAERVITGMEDSGAPLIHADLGYEEIYVNFKFTQGF